MFYFEHFFRDLFILWENENEYKALIIQTFLQNWSDQVSALLRATYEFV